MALGSNNPFPSVLVVEGSAPAAPASGQQRLYLDSSDHKLKRINSSSAITTVEGSGGGGAPVWSWTTKTGAYTATTSDTGIEVDTSGGAVTITLPTAASNTCLYAIKKKTSDTNAVTIATTSAQTIDGATSQILMKQYETLIIASDGANWGIVGRNGAAYGSTFLSGDSTMTTASTAYDIFNTGTLQPGVWEIAVDILIVDGGGGGQFVLKLWDGTTVYATQQFQKATGLYYSQHLGIIVSLASSATIKLTCTSQGNADVVKATPANFNTGATNTASQIRWKRIA